MNKALRRTIIFIVIIAVSFVSGIVFDKVCTAMEYRKFQKSYETQIVAYSGLNGIPCNVVYTLVYTESGFRSNAVSASGSVGLFQLSEAEFLFIRDGLLQEKNQEFGILYDPDTNIRYGTKYLSYLYGRYGNWNTAIAAFHVGPVVVDEWLADPDCVDANGVLVNLPDRSTQSYLKKFNKTLAVYDRLYGET